MAWKNGYIPEGELVIFKRGRNSIDGDWYHGLTPGTYAKHLALVVRAEGRTGRILEISDGWGAYRPYAAQIIARNRYGNGAAVPGTSSHGGFWEGRETLAIDYGNWAYVYGGDRAAFYADQRAVGLTPGMIEPNRGYPDEPWHSIDMAPRAAAALAAASSVVTPIKPKEWDEMATREESKQATKEALQEVLEQGTPRGVYIWTANRGGALIDPAVGGVELAGEEAEVARAIYGHGPELNDRQWDVAMNLAQRLAEKNAALIAAAMVSKQAS